MRRASSSAAIGLAVAFLILAAGVAHAVGPQSSQPFYFVDPPHALGDPVEGANARLVRGPTGVSAEVRTRDLDPGAYTVWWIVWNDPSVCADGCGEDDLGAAGNFVGFATGGIVGASRVGGFGARLGVGEEGVPGETLLISNNGEGLTNPAGAEVHLIIHYHGPVVPDAMPAQVRTFAGGCTPSSTGGLGDGTFDCVDPQAVMFRP